MDKYIIRSDTFDAQKIENAIKNAEVGGVILGDLLCGKRMFGGGIAQQILLTDAVLKSDKILVYQAPLYVTGRNTEQVKSVLALIDGYDKTSYAIVQDFGTARLISREYGHIKPVWGIMGRVRERRFSDEFLNFLKQNGFVGMETCDAALIGRLPAFGLTPYYGDCELQYQTVGRNCYLKYQTGECDPSVCRSGSYSLKAEDGSIEMTVDGYILGKKYRKIPADEYEAVCRNFNVVRIINS